MHDCTDIHDDCYTILSGVATFSIIVMCHRVTLLIGKLLINFKKPGQKSNGCGLGMVNP